VSLLIAFECVACLFIWWRGMVAALDKQPGHGDLDMVERWRRAAWLRNELEQRPWWWLLLSGLAMIALVHWFMDNWERRPWARRGALDGRNDRRARGRRGAHRALRLGHAAHQDLARAQGDRSRGYRRRGGRAWKFACTWLPEEAQSSRHRRAGVCAGDLEEVRK